MRKHSVSIRGHKTSLSMEDEFWSEFRAIARKRNVSLAQLITYVDAKRRENENLSSAIRVYVLKDIRKNDARPDD